jgi:hypothetical protein
MAVRMSDVDFELAVWKGESETSDSSGLNEEGFVWVEGG